MSFILDALKKSESERQRQSGPALLEMRSARPSRALPPWAKVVGVLLILSVAALAWLALGPAAQRTAGPSPLAPLAARPGAGAGADAAAASAPAVPEAPVASPAVAASGADAALNTADAPDATEPTDATDAAANPADIAAAVAPAADASAPAGAHTNLQNYAAVSGTVPDLRLDLHVYAPNPADRYAFINMRKVREGDITPEGAQVRQITREGVVLEYRGAEFLLGRQ